MIDISDEQKFLENYKKKIIRETIKILCKNYQIYDSDNKLMDAEIIQQKIISPKIVKRCIGVTSTIPVSQCTRNAIENYDYCKSHLYKMCLKSQDINKVSLNIKSVEYNNNKNEDNISKCKDKFRKKFIDDSFYWIDDKFIYDMNYNKVGYIDNNSYILTSDPFILETI